MNPLIREWVAKAEGDFATMMRESQVIDTPNYDAICFHAQQCAEKYLKARLQESNIPFGKTHDLVLLLNDVLPIEPDWGFLRSSLQALTDFAVSYRYPGISADETLAREAVDSCVMARDAIRQSLGWDETQ